MATPYIGEIRMVGFSFPPNGWFTCDGQILSIAQYETLYTIIGTTYGGDGVNTFALPDLRSRVPLHWGTSSLGDNFTIGQIGGEETVPLQSNQMPAHSHGLTSVSASQPANTHLGTTNVPAAGNVSAQAADLTHLPVKMYGAAANASTTLAPIQPTGTTQQSGSGLPHENIQPFAVVSYVIAAVGLFPSSN